MRCLTSAQYSMKVTVLSKKAAPVHQVVNPITFAVTSSWTTDGDNTTAAQEPARTIDCSVNTFSNATYKSSQNNISAADIALSINEFLEMRCGPTTKIDTNDRITNIRDSSGKIAWVEEESNNVPTVYSVVSVTPILGPFKAVVEKYVVLRRSDVQSG